MWCGWLKVCQFCFPFQRAGFWFHWSFLLFSSAVRPHWPLKPNALGTPCPVARTPSCGAWEETRNSHSCVRASAIYYFPVCESPTAVIGCNCIMKASILPCCCGFFFIFGYKVSFLVGSSPFLSRVVKQLWFGCFHARRGAHVLFCHLVSCPLSLQCSESWLLLFEM